MTLANKVTIGRILLIPVFVVEVLNFRQTGADWHRWTALAAFAVASLSDGIDGWIARRFNQRSQLGALLDPLADKLLLVSALIVLSRSDDPHLAELPFWLVATVLSRDAILVLGLAITQFTCGHVDVRPRFSGKAATVLQMALVILTLLGLDPVRRTWLEFATLAATLLSGILYLRDGLRQLAASPQSSPLPPSESPR